MEEITLLPKRYEKNTMAANIKESPKPDNICILSIPFVFPSSA